MIGIFLFEEVKVWFCGSAQGADGKAAIRGTGGTNPASSFPRLLLEKSPPSLRVRRYALTKQCKVQSAKQKALCKACFVKRTGNTWSYTTWCREARKATETTFARLLLESLKDSDMMNQ